MKITECPHCGSDEGYYTRDYLHGKSEYNRGFNGEERWNDTVYDLLIHRQGKNAYCMSCKKYIGKAAAIERGYT